MAARIEAFDFSHAALELYDFIFTGAVRLVPGARQAAAARRRAAAVRDAAARADRDGRAGASADPVRDRGDLRLHPGRRGPAGGAGRATGRSGRRRRCRCRGRRGACDRRGAGAPALARHWPGQGRRDRFRPRFEATGYEQTAVQVARLARMLARRRNRSPTPSRRSRSRAGLSRSWPAPTSTLTARASAAADRRRKLESEIDRAERKLANEGFVAKAPTEVVEAEREKLERLRGELEHCEPGRGRALPAVAGAVRHAVRAGPDAPADDRARPSRAPVSTRSMSSAPTASPRRRG